MTSPFALARRIDAKLSSLLRVLILGGVGWECAVVVTITSVVREFGFVISA